MDRPALVLARGPFSFQHLGLDDFDSYDPETQTTTKTTLCSGVFILVALSRVLLESEALAQFCASAALAYRDELQRAGRFFDIGQASGISAPSQAGSMVAGDRGDTIVATSVNFPFTLPWTAKLTPLNHPILEGVDGVLTQTAFSFPTSPFSAPLPSTSGGVASSGTPNPVTRFGV